MNQPPNIPIPRSTLEGLLAVLTQGYQRHPMREVKQATATLERLLAEPEKTDHSAEHVT